MYYMGITVFTGQDRTRITPEAAALDLFPPVKPSDKGITHKPLAFDESMWYGSALGSRGFALSPHREGDDGEGGGNNAVFPDGHVEWRPFTNWGPFKDNAKADRPYSSVIVYDAGAFAARRFY